MPTLPSIYCAGYGSRGALGFRSSGEHAPRAVSAGLPSQDAAVSVAAGNDHSVLVTASGAVFAWGADDDGQLGLGTGAQRSEPARLGSLTSEAVVAASAGEIHTVVATRRGALWAWGDNEFGQLGLGRASIGRGAMTPKPLPSLASHRVVQISAGAHHTVVLTDAGVALSWGCGEDGQLGHGAMANEHTPRIVESFASALQEVVSISAGAAHTLFATSEGGCYSCGEGECGQLGLGSDEVQSAVHTVATRIVVAASIVSVAAGDSHSLALSDRGRLFACGLGDEGQLGLGNADDAFLFAPVAALRGVTVARVYAGGAHSAAVTDADTLYVWGRNEIGELGLGSAEERGDAELQQLEPTRNNMLPSCAVDATWAVAFGAEHSVFARVRRAQPRAAEVSSVPESELAVRVADTAPSTPPPPQRSRDTAKKGEKKEAEQLAHANAREEHVASAPAAAPASPSARESEEALLSRLIGSSLGGFGEGQSALAALSQPFNLATYSPTAVRRTKQTELAEVEAEAEAEAEFDAEAKEEADAEAEAEAETEAEAEADAAADEGIDVVINTAAPLVAATPVAPLAEFEEVAKTLAVAATATKAAVTATEATPAASTSLSASASAIAATTAAAVAMESVVARLDLSARKREVGDSEIEASVKLADDCADFVAQWRLKEASRSKQKQPRVEFATTPSKIVSATAAAAEGILVITTTTMMEDGDEVWGEGSARVPPSPSAQEPLTPRSAAATKTREENLEKQLRRLRRKHMKTVAELEHGQMQIAQFSAMVSRFGTGESAQQFANGVNALRTGRRAKEMARASKKIAMLMTKTRDQKERLRVRTEEANVTKVALGRTMAETTRMVQFSQVLRATTASQVQALREKHTEEMRRISSERDEAVAEAKSSKRELRHLRKEFESLEESAGLQIEQLTAMLSSKTRGGASSSSSWFG